MYSCGWNIESFPPWEAGPIAPPLLVLTKWTKKHNRLMKKRKTAKSAWNYAWKFTYFFLFLNRGVNVLRNTIRGSLSKARITCSSHRMLFKLLRTEWKLSVFSFNDTIYWNFSILGCYPIILTLHHLSIKYFARMQQLLSSNLFLEQMWFNHTAWL